MIKVSFDREALERLIGGDTEAEVQLKEGIVQAFAKRHLKAVADSKAFQPYLEQIAGAVTEELKSQIPIILVAKGSHLNNWKDQWQLRDDDEKIKAFKKTLAEVAENYVKPMYVKAIDDVKKFIDAQMTKALEKIEIEVIKTVEKQLSANMELMVRKEVNRRLKVIADNVASGSTGVGD